MDRWGFLQLFSFKRDPEKMSDLIQGHLVKKTKCPAFSQTEAEALISSVSRVQCKD